MTDTAMTKLTLPIVPGKKYMRRDGQIVTAKSTYDSNVVQVGSTLEKVWADVGIANRGTMSSLQTDWGLAADYIEPTGHIHAALMAKYAEDAATNSEPWKLWEFERNCSWYSISEHPAWDTGKRYRRKPRTININGFVVPEPLRVAPAKGTQLYWVNLGDTKGYSAAYWMPGLEFWLKAGMVHATEQAARTHAEALLSFTKVTS